MMLTLRREGGGGNEYGSDGDRDSNESYDICTVMVVT